MPQKMFNKISRCSSVGLLTKLTIKSLSQLESHLKRLGRAQLEFKKVLESWRTSSPFQEELMDINTQLSQN
jgi:hypothetical protein